jgi:hypothetical protein
MEIKQKQMNNIIVVLEQESITIVYIQCINPSRTKAIILKKNPKAAISSSRSPNEFFSLFCTFNRRIVPWTTRKTCAKSFAKIDCTFCEIITFEVERKVFFYCPRQGQQTLTARGAKNFNYVIWGFWTIVMHIILGTYVPNLRGRG